MNASLQRFAQTARSTVKLALCAALLPTAWAGLSGFDLSPAGAVAATTLRAAAPQGLPAEFAAIRPADLDGGVPPIPPSELWPAQ